MKAPENSVLETIKILEKKGLGQKKINFRLKDWGVSRQRYWGCPIPIIYDENGKDHPLPKSMLPVKLPENINLNEKGNPLGNQRLVEIEKMEKNTKRNGYSRYFCLLILVLSKVLFSKKNEWL